ncbi:MAG: 30S ribosomal protein S16 [Saprospiraceae bacterium]|nr:30S ribosomal protein S16 [Saprospiraceae bacterium]MBL0026086.1 30S ribosomal protein S16 [Saprospiraceae bacterium]
MAVKIRLSRKGRKKAPFYHIVVADSRSPRDGKFIEKLGTYNPMTKPATIEIDRNAAFDWLVKGAQPTDTVKAILRFKGVFYKKHLMRGVTKGAMTIEQADAQWQKWIDDKENKVESRRQQSKSDLESFRIKVSGEAKVKVVIADEETKEAAHAFMVNDATDSVAKVHEEIVEQVADVADVKEEILETVTKAEEVADDVKEETVAEVEDVVVEAVKDAEEVKDDIVETTEEVIEDVVSDVSDNVEEKSTEE